MAKKKESSFSVDQAKREREMEELAELLNGEAPELKRKTVRINISLSEETNAKLTRKSNETGISKSALIQHWIHENC